MTLRIPVLVIFASYLGYSVVRCSVCPHDEQGLERWSDPAIWDTGTVSCFFFLILALNLNICVLNIPNGHILWQTVKTQMKCHILWHFIRIFTVC